MFAFERDQTDWHQWSGQFDPLYEAKPDWKYAKWFREGAIRFELKGYKEQHILVPLEYTFQYLWWKNIEHFLGELCEFQTNDFIQNITTLKTRASTSCTGSCTKTQLV